MNSNSQTWVCATCGQGFTRKSTAVRHNKNLHAGMAIVVRPYEYIIGRLSRKFPESDPSLYRRQHKGAKNRASRDNTARTSGWISPNVVHETMHGSAKQPPPMEATRIGNFGTQFNDANLESYNQAADLKSPDSSVKLLSERLRKLDEFVILAKKLHPLDIAKQMITMVGMQASLGDDAFLEKNLASLRSMDRAKAH